MSGNPVEQTNVIKVLQLADSKADRRLRKVKAVSGFGNAVFLIYGNKNFYMAQSHENLPDFG